MQNMNGTMHQAMELMRSGNLREATQVIQRALGGSTPPSAPAAPHGRSQRGTTIEGECHVMADARGATQPAPASVGDPAPGPAGAHEDDTFSTHQFRCAHGTLQYKLFVPSGTVAGAPLVVMLHGCTQSPDDFARGTRMNSIARTRGCVVAYPAQAHKKNSSRCWNWFRDGDQQRGSGEPALIASLALHLVQEHRLDARRVYAAGLSAGGAMAAILGATYPDVFAAVGVHSGLPFGAARDLPSALAAMKRGAGTAPLVQGVPAIVFHGDRDATVDPCNGEAVVAQFTETTGAGRDGLQRTVERGSIPSGHGYTRISYRTADGKVMAEHWEVHGAGHAWFGGDPSGSYTDPSGPDASEHMLRFFGECVRAPAN